MVRAGNYERKQPEDGDDLAKLANKLTADLHSYKEALYDLYCSSRNLSLLTMEPVLSKGWCKMADLVGRISTVTEMESKLPKSSANATLWETEELALRYIMEDGKLNLCLRNLVAFREYQREDNSSRPPSDVDEGRLDKFEKGLGLTLKNAWSHLEAIQTTDLPMLMKHIGAVLQEAVSDAPTRERVERYLGVDLHERQETLVLHYLRGMCNHIEDILSLSFMRLVRDEKIVERLVDFLMEYHTKLRDDDVLCAAQALSEIVDSEDFQTYEDAYMTPATSAKMAGWRELFLERFTSDHDARKTIQPLLRFVQGCRYAHK